MKENIKNIILCFVLLILLIFIIFFIYKEKFDQPDICICMSYTPNIKSYSELAEKINRKYANKNGYDFKVFHKEVFNRAPQWCKIEVINELLQKNRYKYLFWIDSDAFFNKHDMKIEDIINNDSDKNIIICNDDINNGNEDKNRITVNTGTIIVKCNEWSKNFFKLLWDYETEYRFVHFHEQTVLENFIKLNILNCKKYVAVKDGKLFNSEINQQLYDETLYNNYVVHLATLDETSRINHMKNWLSQFDN